MPQPLVLAIEPDLRQAAIVKRIVREKVLADVAVVDSRDAALEAMRTTMPDVLLLSALMSPREEDELIAHLRTLEHADHLQTHTIPQLASALGPAESRGPRGLLAAFRRKKEPEAAPSGCDPDLFAEEIRVFLQRAADKKKERSSANSSAQASDTTWRAAQPQKNAAPATDMDAAPETDSSSSSAWASPFEWKPTVNPTSFIADPESSIASPEASIAEREPFVPSPEPSIASSESLMSHLRPSSGITTVADLRAAAYTDAPHLAASFEPLIPVIREPEPTCAAAIEVPAPIVEFAAQVDVAVPIEVATPIDVAATLMEAAPLPEAPPIQVAAPIQDAARIRDERSLIPDSGLGIRDKRSGIRDKRLGALASWARSENPGRDATHGSDDLHALLTGLSVPSSVVAVGYGRGCRIRRVRVPAAREPQEAEAVGAVIISKRLLAEQRELRT